MQHGGGDAGAVQAARQLVGEQDVGQFRLAVGPLPGVAALALQVTEVDLPLLVSAADAMSMTPLGGKPASGA